MMRDQKLWTWHVLAGVVILVFLGLHMLTMHLNTVLPIERLNPVAGKAPIDWQNVAARGKSVVMMASYIVLLGAALFHGLYGLRNILFELDPAAWLRKTLSVVITLTGVGLFIFGAWAAFAGFTLARAL
jgi:succinate dehydrogenase/fumarate reductase cytochrome b subunit